MTSIASSASSRAETSPIRTRSASSVAGLKSSARSDTGRELKAARSRVRPVADAHEIQTEGADRDLVAVVELVPVDALAVQEDAVQAAIVEDACSGPVAMDERVAARHRRIVEADVGGEAAADTRPAILEGGDVDAVVMLERDVVAVRDKRLACLQEPVRCDYVRDLVELIGVLVLARHKHRRALELAATALGAVRYLVQLMQRYGEAP